MTIIKIEYNNVLDESFLACLSVTRPFLAIGNKNNNNARDGYLVVAADSDNTARNKRLLFAKDNNANANADTASSVKPIHVFFFIFSRSMVARTTAKQGSGKIQRTSLDHGAKRRLDIERHEE